MPNSFSFNGTDLSAYGLIVTSKSLPVNKLSTYTQLIDRSYGYDSIVPPKTISLNVSVTGASKAILEGYLDSIGLVLNETTDKQLILDSMTDRYWMARPDSMAGNFRSPTLWEGTADFTCHDPFAYDITEDDDDYNIDADPKTLFITGGGTAIIYPVYTLTSGAIINPATIKTENTYTLQDLTWTGVLGVADELEIDTEHWTVKLNNVEDMDISGQFPLLLPSSNAIKVTGFGVLGSLNITYRKRYV